MYQILYCKVLFDLSLKNLTKNSLTGAIEQNSNRKAFSFETFWLLLIQPWTSKTKVDSLFHMKDCTITNLTGGQILVMITKMRTLVKATIMQHLDLNNMLVNYYKWRQIIHCKRFCSRQRAQMTLVSNKIYIIRFPKRNSFDQWKAYCKKRIIYALKTCLLTKFYTPLICVIQNWSIIVFIVV